MTSQDLSAFSEMFRELASMFRLYGTEEQKASTLSAYFQTFQDYPLERVRKGYEQLKTTATKWPVPAQWIAAMPKGVLRERPLMDWRQMKASDEAERLFYEGELCTCSECADANVTHLNLRYVPCLDADGAVIEYWHPNRNKAVLLGEWIHGYPLTR